MIVEVNAVEARPTLMVCRSEQIFLFPDDSKTIPFQLAVDEFYENAPLGHIEVIQFVFEVLPDRFLL